MKKLSPSVKLRKEVSEFIERLQILHGTGE